MQDDFKPVLQELLATHPGLEFLQSTPEFQERYGPSTLNYFIIIIFVFVVIISYSIVYGVLSFTIHIWLV